MKKLKEKDPISGKYKVDLDFSDSDEDEKVLQDYAVFLQPLHLVDHTGETIKSHENSTLLNMKGFIFDI